MADQMILGEGVSFSMDTETTGLNNNVFVVGSTGCGKTMSVVTTRLLNTNEHSLIVPVSKRKLIELFAPVFKERGYRVGVLDFVNPQRSVLSFDPLQSVHSQQDIQSLADFVVRSASDSPNCIRSDPYWENTAVSLLSALIYLTLKTCENPTFLDVYDLFCSLQISSDSFDDEITTTLDKKFDSLKDEGDKESMYAFSWWQDFRVLPPRTAQCVYGCVSTPLNYMFTPELLKMVHAKAPIRFQEIAQRKTVLFVYTSAVRPVLNHYVKLFYSEAIKDLFEYAENQPEGKLPIPVDFICDDFANGGRIQNFPEYISIFREKGISVTLLVQSESQLRSMYGAEGAVTILDNCDTTVYMGGTNVETIESVCKRVSAPFEEVYSMPLGQIYVLRRGQKPIRTTRYNVLEDKRYQEITERYEQKIAAESGASPAAS